MTTQRLLLSEPPDASIPTAAAGLRETFRVLDVVGSGWIVVLSFTTAAPPSTPQQGDAYLCPAGASGAWEGHQNHLAIYTPVGWIFRSPRYGWIAVVVDQNTPYGQVLEYTGIAWTEWVLPAAQISTSPVGVDFVSTDLAELIIEINLRFLANEQTASDQQDELDDHEFRIASLEGSGGGGGGGGNVTPDTHPTSPDVADDEFETGSVIDTTGGRRTGATAWAWRNQGAATGVVVSAQGSLILTSPAGSGDNIRVVEQAIAGAGRWRARVGLLATGGFGTAGMCFVNSSNGKLVTIAKQFNGEQAESSHYNSVTAFSAGNQTGVAKFGGLGTFCYMELEYDGTNIIARMSGTGVDGSFWVLRTESAASFLGTPDKVGLFVNSNNAGDLASNLCDWFRRVA